MFGMGETPTTAATSRLSRPWDAFEAYLFDIDGTLIQSHDAVHYFAFCESLSAVAGRSLNLEGVVAHGNVDEGILRDAWTRAGVPEADWRPRLAEVRAAMCRFVDERQGDLQIEVLGGAREVLQHLRSRGAELAVATGNLRGIGEAKLRRAGLLDFFPFGGWSDGHEYRRDVLRAAVDRVHHLVGRTARMCVVGDTPEDVRAARANGLEVIAVATGIYTFDHLQAEGPDLCLHALTELAPSAPSDSLTNA